MLYTATRKNVECGGAEGEEATLYSTRPHSGSLCGVVYRNFLVFVNSLTGTVYTLTNSPSHRPVGTAFVLVDAMMTISTLVRVYPVRLWGAAILDWGRDYKI